MVLANLLYAVDFTLLQMGENMKHKHEASTFRIQVLASVRLYLYKHTHADVLTLHYLNQDKTIAVPMEMNYMYIYVTKWTGIKCPKKIIRLTFM